MASSLTPQEFVAKWKPSELRERASAQEHFIDVCRLLGHPTPAEADPAGIRFTFEKGASKATGGQGWADVWKRGGFGWEYKSKHSNLEKAYGQLLLYSGALENPPLLIVSDMVTIRIHTHFTNTVKATHDLTLDDLLDPGKLDILRRAFNDPDSLRPGQTTTQVTEQAAEKFARIAQILRRYGHDSHEIAHFLIRLLFCLFAEDVDILPAGLFSRLVTGPRPNATAFAAQLRQLFGAMAAGGFFGAELIKHVDGGLFDDDAALSMDSDSLRLLAEVCHQDWSAIEPAILGTLFERGLDPEKRSQLGAHFTAKEDILLVVEPVLMRPLRGEWAQIQVLIDELLRRRNAAPTKKKRDNATRDLFAALRTFRARLAQVQVLDAACGSGNFLYVALRLLLDLEKEVINRAAELGDTVSFPMVSPAQLHGIELNAYAFELAQATIWIGYIQWLRENGFGLPGEPILRPLEAIRRMDAILAYDAEGQPVEPEWPAVDVIVGNPPFLGSKKMRSELGDAYVDALVHLYAGRVPPKSDLVCYWFERARRSIETSQAKRCGLLATQAIRKGLNRSVLDAIKRTGDIFAAYADRVWFLDGAAVHVSIVCFDDGSEQSRVLDGKPVMSINADLTGNVDLTGARRLPENSGLAFSGTKKYGAFEIDESTAQVLLSGIGNPNGRPNSDVVKPWANGIDIAQRGRNMYIVDFGVDATEAAASQYELPFEFVNTHVRPSRAREKEVATRDKWWLFQRPRPEMRRAIAKLPRFIVTPAISKHRLFVWLKHPTVPDQQLAVIARSDDYFLGLLQSRLHEIWVRANGPQLRDAVSATRYTITTCFETFPFPWPPGKEPVGDARVEAIAEAARRLVEQRDSWLHPPGVPEEQLTEQTLTNLYNKRPTWLELAHRRLDAAVLDAYGWRPELADDEILEQLLELNLERVGNQPRV